MPELALEAAEVSTTRLTTMAAAPSPARANMPMNGLLPGSMLRHGLTDMMMTRAPT